MKKIILIVLVYSLFACNTPTSVPGLNTSDTSSISTDSLYKQAKESKCITPVAIGVPIRDIKQFNKNTDAYRVYIINHSIFHTK